MALRNIFDAMTYLDLMREQLSASMRTARMTTEDRSDEAFLFEFRCIHGGFVGVIGTGSIPSESVIDCAERLAALVAKLYPGGTGYPDFRQDGRCDHG